MSSNDGPRYISKPIRVFKSLAPDYRGNFWFWRCWKGGRHYRGIEPTQQAALDAAIKRWKAR